MVTAVAEIYMTRVSVFTGNYTHYEEVRSRELAALMERWRAQQEEIAHIEAFIAKFRYNASKARLVQSRITALEKMERIEVPPVVKTIHFPFRRLPIRARFVLSAARACQVIRRTSVSSAGWTWRSPAGTSSSWSG